MIAIGAQRSNRWIAPCSLGADEACLLGKTVVRHRRSARSLTDGRGRRYRDRSGRAARSLGAGDALVRKGGIDQLLRRLSHRHQGRPRHRAAALLRNHLQGELPSHAGAHPTLARIWSPTAKSRAAHFVNHEEPLSQLRGDCTTCSPPQRSHQDRHHPVTDRVTVPVAQLQPKEFVRQARPRSTRRLVAARSRSSTRAGSPPTTTRIFSRQLPAAQALHQDFYNVYAFCRWADDLGDEIGDPAESLRLLAWWRERTGSHVSRRSGSILCSSRLQARSTRHQIPIEPFDRSDSAPSNRTRP